MLFCFGLSFDMDLSGVYIVVDFFMNFIFFGSDSIDVYGIIFKVFKERMFLIYLEVLILLNIIVNILKMFKYIIKVYWWGS